MPLPLLGCGALMKVEFTLRPHANLKMMESPLQPLLPTLWLLAKQGLTIFYCKLYLICLHMAGPQKT